MNSHLQSCSSHLTYNLCNLIIPWTHLVVHLQWVSFSFCLEVLCVGVHCEVNLLVEALYMNRVPVLVIQQTAHSDSNTTAGEPQPAVVWSNTKKTARSQWGALHQWTCKCVREPRLSSTANICSVKLFKYDQFLIISLSYCNLTWISLYLYILCFFFLSDKCINLKTFKTSLVCCEKRLSLLGRNEVGCINDNGHVGVKSLNHDNILQNTRFLKAS